MRSAQVEGAPHSTAHTLIRKESAAPPPMFDPGPYLPMISCAKSCFGTSSEPMAPDPGLRIGLPRLGKSCKSTTSSSPLHPGAEVTGTEPECPMISFQPAGHQSFKFWRPASTLLPFRTAHVQPDLHGRLFTISQGAALYGASRSNACHARRSPARVFPDPCRSRRIFASRIPYYATLDRCIPTLRIPLSGRATRAVHAFRALWYQPCSA